MLEWRERPHDDLVLVVAIVAWQAETYVPFYVGVIWVRPTVLEASTLQRAN